MQYVEIMKISLESKQILVSPVAWQVGSEAILLRGAWYQRWPWLLQNWRYLPQHWILQLLELCSIFLQTSFILH